MSRRADLVVPDVPGFPPGEQAPRPTAAPLRAVVAMMPRVLTVLALAGGMLVEIPPAPSVAEPAPVPPPVAGWAAAVASQVCPELRDDSELRAGPGLSGSGLSGTGLSGTGLRGSGVRGSEPAAAARPRQSAPRRPVADVAHRGASAYAPENTLVAFRMARTRRADLFEIDVQRTKDGQLVLIHDRTLARTTNVEQVFPRRRPWTVGDFTLAEIRRLDAGSWFGKAFRGEPVPTLGETLRHMETAGLGLLLEVKSPGLYPGIGRQVATELRRFPSWSRPDPGGRRLMVQSFDWNFARDFKPLMPWVPVGLLGKPKVARLPRLSRFADQINPSHRTLTPAYVTSVHRLGMEIFTWTIDNPRDMRRAIRLRVNGIISNRPDVLRKVIANPAAALTRGVSGGSRTHARAHGRTDGRTDVRTRSRTLPPSGPRRLAGGIPCA
jgi:glycerophosphoryl diester phosphodiesterase